MGNLIRLSDKVTAETASEGATDNRSIIPLATFLKEPELYYSQISLARVFVTAADAIEPLAPHLDKVAVVAIEFKTFGEGRGYSLSRLLRQRYAFKGEIRAVGAAVRQDLLFFMVRCGFDAFEMAPGENLAEARYALHRFSLAYQPAIPRPEVLEARFTATHRTLFRPVLDEPHIR